ncbi:hypothetical protein SDC9_169155 [bioreactor metagenome]|uniref:Uncharacterized protein n=1 Tax=bioreactor metagenome TaxID=1076179 RepID=A0A645G547_9ZZZZ
MVVAVDPEQDAARLRPEFAQQGKHLLPVGDAVRADDAPVRKDDAGAGRRPERFAEERQFRFGNQKLRLMALFPRSRRTVMPGSAIGRPVEIRVDGDEAESVAVKEIITFSGHPERLLHFVQVSGTLEVVIAHGVPGRDGEPVVALDLGAGGGNVMTEIPAVHDEIHPLPCRARQNRFQPLFGAVPIAFPEMEVGKHAECYALHFSSLPF